MSFPFRRMAWALVVAGGMSQPLFAQTTGGTTTGGSTTGGTTGGTAGSNSSAAQLATMSTAIISAPSAVQTATSGAVNQSNFLGPTFANPYYQGRSGAQLTDAPGGFGVPLYNSTGTTTGARGTGTTGATGGFGGTTTAARGATTGLGGATSAGGLGGAGGLGRTGGLGGTGGQTGFGGVGGATGTAGGAQGSSRRGGVVIPLQRQIAYQAVLKFKGPPPTPPAVMQSNLQEMLARTPFVSNSGQVQVSAEGNQVILRGTVADDDEARLIEGMVRLTPGVYSVRNELTVR